MIFKNMIRIPCILVMLLIFFQQILFSSNVSAQPRKLSRGTYFELYGGIESELGTTVGIDIVGLNKIPLGIGYNFFLVGNNYRQNIGGYRFFGQYGTSYGKPLTETYSVWIQSIRFFLPIICHGKFNQSEGWKSVRVDDYTMRYYRGQIRDYTSIIVAPYFDTGFARYAFDYSTTYSAYDESFSEYIKVPIITLYNLGALIQISNSVIGLRFSPVYYFNPINYDIYNFEEVSSFGYIVELQLLNYFTIYFRDELNLKSFGFSLKAPIFFIGSISDFMKYKR
jgi:hypothetical protein